MEVLWADIVQTETLECADGPFTWQCVSLARALQIMVTESSGLRDALRAVWHQQPCTSDAPYHLVIYADEVVPGNVLRLDNKRKVFCVYVTIREVGPSYLKHESMWVPVAAIRSAKTKEVKGGVSACMRVLFRRWFLSDKLAEQGVVLDLDIPGSRYATFYFAVGNVVADGDAYRAIWSAKGASGKLPCLLCKNVLSDHVVSDYLVHFSCPHVERFDAASSSDIWEKVDKLHERVAAVSKKDFENLQMLYGITYAPTGLLWDKELRPFVKPVECITFDAMHTLVSNGIVQNETGLLTAALKSIGIKWEALRSFVDADWRVCRALGSVSTLRGCFGKPREQAFQSGGVFKSGASEMLLLFPVLLHFVHTVVAPSGQLKNETASYAALGPVLSLVREGKEGARVADALAKALREHAEAFGMAYPDAGFKPKNHYVYHVAQHLRRDPMILDAFVWGSANTAC